MVRIVGSKIEHLVHRSSKYRSIGESLLEKQCRLSLSLSISKWSWLFPSQFSEQTRNALAQHSKLFKSNPLMDPFFIFSLSDLSKDIPYNASWNELAAPEAPIFIMVESFEFPC